MASPYFNPHAHSQYSVLDATTPVKALVQQAHKNGQPAIGLTDHGNMAGAVELYLAARDLGIKPFPGVEGYLIDPMFGDDWENPVGKGVTVGRYHFGLLALDEQGYKALVQFTTQTHTRPRFNRFPRATLADLATLGKDAGAHVALLTGCYFGWLQQTLVTDGPDAALKVLQVYQRMFPNLYVEVQNHDIDHSEQQHSGVLRYEHDNDIVAALIELADTTGLPVVAGQDSHYTHQKQKAAHNLMKRMVYSGSADDEFPGDSFHMATTEWVEDHYTAEQWTRILEGHQDLLDKHNMTIGPLDTYKPDIPRYPNSFKTLRSVTKRKMRELGLDTRIKYVARYNEEMQVIEKLGMADYFMVVSRFVKWCEQNGIFIEARGSANGSLVLYMLGVTQVDPIVWGTQFDRFLSVDRIKPPDVDIDIEAKHKPAAVKYFVDTYGAHQIGTWGKLGSRFDPESGEERGSVLQTWLMYKRRSVETWALDLMERKNTEAGDDRARRMTKAQAMGLAKGTFFKKYGNITSMSDILERNPQEAAALWEMSSGEMDIYRSYGVHPGGVLLQGERFKVEDYVPMMLVASSNTTVTQYDMDSLEAMGFIKMDVLGQRSLEVMRRAGELAGVPDPTDFSWIPDKDLRSFRMLSAGRPNNGIFHAEGYSKSKGYKRMRVKSVDDVILGSALFMPGAVSTGQTDLYLSRRESGEPVEYLHPIFEKVLSSTYGAVVFQEQVINIMRGLGMDIAGINNFFKVVKDSGRGATARNAQRLAEIREQFNDLCSVHDIDSDAAWEQTAGFVAYGFNRCATGHTGILVDMGLSGKTEMHRGGANQHTAAEMTVREFYDVFHGSKTPARDKYRYQGLRIAAHKDGRIVLDRVKDIWWVGRKTTVKVTLEDGKSITTTPNHKHLSNRGWVRADELTVDDELATMGDYEHWAAPTGGTPSKFNGRKAAYEALPPYCQMCGSAEGRLEVAHLNHDRQDNSPENIRRLCNPCHKQWDYDTGRRVTRWNKGRPIVWSRVASVTKGLVEDVYDIEMEGDDHSWVGNGIVTHNSHATGYGIRTYRFAYLKTHYPLAFMTALLEVNAAHPDKITHYVAEARRMKLRVYAADVNYSGANWTMDEEFDGIRRGLVSVAGVGIKSAEQIAEQAPFTSVEDMIERVPGRALTGGKDYIATRNYSGILGKLYTAGALASVLNESKGRG